MPLSFANAEVKIFYGSSDDFSSTGASPTLSEVESVIDMVDNEIYSALGTTGITSASLLGLLKKYSAMGTAGLLLQRYSKPEDSASNYYSDKYDKFIDKLITDKKYKDSLLQLESSSVTIFVSSNVIDGTHTGNEAKVDSVEFMDEGFKA